MGDNLGSFLLVQLISLDKYVGIMEWILKTIQGDDYYRWLSMVDFEMFFYVRDKSKINTIKNLSFKNDFEVKVILNNGNITNKEEAIKEANEKFEESKNKFFKTLCTFKFPIITILIPVYRYAYRYKKKKIHYTGFNSIGIVIDYIKYNDKCML